MKQQNFERELPEGYRQVCYIDAKSAKFGIIFNLIAVAVCAVVMFAAFGVTYLFAEQPSSDISSTSMLILMWATLAIMVIYLVLHELLHGVAYKSLTGEKLTFGLSWSCAFCGVPNIYTYRKTSIIASATPLVVFSVVFCVLCAVLFYVNIRYFFAAAFLLGMHLGGCSGDIYMLILMAKYKNPKLLVRDTGPAQTFYMPEE